jgi:cell division septation protein DedD
MNHNYLLSCLSSLLYQHDCVILPNFGGFVTHYLPAQIQFIDGQILPPRRRVAFNPKLINNDGLFISFVAQSQDLPYKIAADKVAQWVQTLGAQLAQEQYLILADIGKIYFNSDGKLEFSHDSTNFLRQSYALPVVRKLSPISRTAQPPAATVNNSTATRSFAARNRKAAAAAAFASETPVVASRFSPQYAAISGVLLLLIGLPFVIWLLNPKNTMPNNTQTASTLNFGSNNITTITEPTTETIDTPLTNEVVEEPAENIVTPPSNESEDKKWLRETEEVVKKVDKKANTYVIVIGAFSDPVNAKRVLRRLEKEGYFPDLATTNKGLQRIGIQITCAESELKLHLQDIRKKFNEQAWVIRD